MSCFTIRHFLVLASAFAIWTPLYAEELTLPDVQVTLIEAVEVPVREAGVIEQIVVQEGQLVTEDEPLIRLHDDVMRLQTEAAVKEADAAQLESENDVDTRFAQKSYAMAAADHQRAAEAVDRVAKSVSQSELDQLKLKLERAELAAEQADRDMRVAELRAQLQRKKASAFQQRLAHYQVRSPLAGRVVAIYKRQGEWVTAGEPIVRVVQLDRLRVEAFVDGNQFDESLMGAAVRLNVIIPPGEQITLNGYVTFVSPEMHPVTGQIRLWAEIGNPSLVIRPGMRGTLTIDTTDAVQRMARRRAELPR